MSDQNTEEARKVLSDRVDRVVTPNNRQAAHLPAGSIAGLAMVNSL